MNKTITMDYSDYQNIEKQLTEYQTAIDRAFHFEKKVEELVLSSEEKKIIKKIKATDPLYAPVWIPLTQSQILERIELLINRFTDEDFEAAVQKWEKQLN